MRFEFLLDFGVFGSRGLVALLLNNRQHPGSKKADGGVAEEHRGESKIEAGGVIGVIGEQGEVGEDKKPK